MGLLGGMPQTDYDFIHNPAPSSALVRRQVRTDAGTCSNLLPAAPPCPQHNTQINHHNLLYLILGQPKSA